MSSTSRSPRMPVSPAMWRNVSSFRSSAAACAAHQADDELEDVGADRGEVVDVERPCGRTRRARDLEIDEVECELDALGAARRHADAQACPAEMGHAGHGGGGRERGVEFDADHPALVPDQQPGRVGTGRRSFVAGAVGQLHERHVEPARDERRRRTGRVVDADADPHRTCERLHDGRHDDRGIVIGEQRDPSHVPDASVRRADRVPRRRSRAARCAGRDPTACASDRADCSGPPAGSPNQAEFVPVAVVRPNARDRLPNVPRSSSAMVIADAPGR